jgi:hypothetical protein
VHTQHKRRRALGSYTSTCCRTKTCVAIGSFPIITYKKLQKNFNLRNIIVNTRISIGANYLENDLSILAIPYIGLGFQAHDLHYEWGNVKGVVST